MKLTNKNLAIISILIPIIIAIIGWLFFQLRENIITNSQIASNSNINEMIQGDEFNFSNSNVNFSPTINNIVNPAIKVYQDDIVENIIYNRFLANLKKDGEDLALKNFLIIYPYNIKVFVPLLHTDITTIFGMCTDDEKKCHIYQEYIYTLDKENIVCYIADYSQGWNSGKFLTLNNSAMIKERNCNYTNLKF